MVHLFGGVSFLTCANFTLRKTADDNATEFGPEIANTIKCNIYVDNCLKSAEDEQAAIYMADQLCLLVHKGGFRLSR